MVSAWARPASSSSTSTTRGRPAVSGTSTVTASGRSSSASRRSNRIERPSTCQVASAEPARRQPRVGGRPVGTGWRAVGQGIEVAARREPLPSGGHAVRPGHEVAREPTDGPRLVPSPHQGHPARQALVDGHLVQAPAVGCRQVVAARGADERDDRVRPGAAVRPHAGGPVRLEAHQLVLPRIRLGEPGGVEARIDGGAPWPRPRELAEDVERELQAAERPAVVVGRAVLVGGDEAVPEHSRARQRRRRRGAARGLARRVAAGDGEGAELDREGGGEHAGGPAPPTAVPSGEPTVSTSPSAVARPSAQTGPRRSASGSVKSHTSAV